MSELFAADQIAGNPPEGQIRILKDADGRKIRLVGITQGRKCKECAYFYRVEYAKTYRRCKFDPKKNWKANTEACGSFQERNP